MTENTTHDEFEAEKAALISHYEALLATKDGIIAEQRLIIDQQATTLQKLQYEVDEEVEAKIADAEETIERAITKRMTEKQNIRMSQMANEHVTQTRRARAAERKVEWQKSVILQAELAMEAYDRDFQALERQRAVLQREIHIFRLRRKVEGLERVRDGLDRRLREVQERIEEAEAAAEAEIEMGASEGDDVREEEDEAQGQDEEDGGVAGVGGLSHTLQRLFRSSRVF